MTVEFLCPHCRAENQAGSDTPLIQCRRCGQTVTLTFSDHSRQSGQIEQCAVCGNQGFYLQKDFNPRLGLLIFAIGVLFSYHTKFLSLLLATALDFALYYLLPTVTICYQCRAIYRDFQVNPAHRGFDHLTALKYSKTAT
ncbi:MAG: hypothetical protein ONB48_01025 [candidate division KSB1 bacterium]|nr:hypothetical protein [candidate division KSB1 bacterium]MDZ7272739.1 hypothetical protein [candidate division KSB1 bacterium]MDZ7284236.1 hypothetical protein [candidate division KSB1 bacterium]MDZ7297365.1 hypothetical protein [candidate division KSB1 bacterium]MDZ7309061.1 hypothetical protein [candidate division KSB1 bacterium]